MIYNPLLELFLRPSEAVRAGHACEFLSLSPLPQRERLKMHHRRWVRRHYGRADPGDPAARRLGHDLQHRVPPVQLRDQSVLRHHQRQHPPLSLSLSITPRSDVHCSSSQRLDRLMVRDRTGRQLCITDR